MVIRKTRVIFSLLLIALGTAHIGFTPRSLNLDALWFLGAGLALVFLGLINIMEYVPSRRWYAWARVGANLLGTAYLAAITWIIPEPQAFLSVILTAVLTTCAAIEIRNYSGVTRRNQ